MNEEAIIKRKIQLNNQVLRLIRVEREGLKHQLNLLRLRGFLHGRAGKVFDSKLSAQIDAVQFLLDTFGTDSQTFGGINGQN
jgi:hypothetical protein